MAEIEITYIDPLRSSRTFVSKVFEVGARKDPHTEKVRLGLPSLLLRRYLDLPRVSKHVPRAVRVAAAPVVCGQ